MGCPYGPRRMMPWLDNLWILSCMFDDNIFNGWSLIERSFLGVFIESLFISIHQVCALDSGLCVCVWAHDETDLRLISLLDLFFSGGDLQSSYIPVIFLDLVRNISWTNYFYWKREILMVLWYGNVYCTESVGGQMMVYRQPSR